jgi:ATP adenylyltransferase
MVVPYQHTGNLADLPPETGTELFTLAQVAAAAVREVMHPQGFNLGMNVGEAAGAGIADHLHLHVVPRWAGDTNFMPVLAEAKVMPELLTATAAKLRPAFQRLAPQP